MPDLGWAFVPRLLLDILVGVFHPGRQQLLKLPVRHRRTAVTGQIADDQAHRENSVGMSTVRSFSMKQYGGQLETSTPM